MTARTSSCPNSAIWPNWFSRSDQSWLQTAPSHKNKQTHTNMTMKKRKDGRMCPVNTKLRCQVKARQLDPTTGQINVTSMLIRLKYFTSASWNFSSPQEGQAHSSQMYTHANRLLVLISTDHQLG